MLFPSFASGKVRKWAFGICVKPLPRSPHEHKLFFWTPAGNKTITLTPAVVLAATAGPKISLKARFSPRKEAGVWKNFSRRRNQSAFNQRVLLWRRDRPKGLRRQIDNNCWTMGFRGKEKTGFVKSFINFVIVIYFYRIKWKLYCTIIEILISIKCI